MQRNSTTDAYKLFQTPSCSKGTVYSSGRFSGQADRETRVIQAGTSCIFHLSPKVRATYMNGTLLSLNQHSRYIWTMLQSLTMARKIFTSWIGLKPTKVRKFSRRKQGSDSDIIDQNMRFSLCDQKKEEHGIPENRDIVCLLYRLVSNHHASYNTSDATS